MASDKPKGIPFTIAVDFDGCICEYDFPRCGQPRRDVIELLRHLRTKGWRIIVHSSRVNQCWPNNEWVEKVSDMLNFLTMHCVPFHEIWGLHTVYEGAMGDLGCRWVFELNRAHTGKPVAHVYLDDRALFATRFPRGTSPECAASTLESLCISIADAAERGYRKGLDSA